MLPNNCDIVIVMALWAGRRLKDMDKMKQVAPEVLSQPELLVSCFWGRDQSYKASTSSMESPEHLAMIAGSTPSRFNL